jgi:acyl carrier protein
VSPACLDRVCSVATHVFEVPEESLGAFSSPDTVETWDSLQHLNLVLALEQEFGIQFTPEEIEEMLSLELIALLIEERMKASTVAYAS